MSAHMSTVKNCIVFENMLSSSCVARARCWLNEEVGFFSINSPCWSAFVLHLLFRFSILWFHLFIFDRACWLILLHTFCARVSVELASRVGWKCEWEMKILILHDSPSSAERSKLYQWWKKKACTDFFQAASSLRHSVVVWVDMDWIYFGIPLIQPIASIFNEIPQHRSSLAAVNVWNLLSMFSRRRCRRSFLKFRIAQFTGWYLNILKTFLFLCQLMSSWARRVWVKQSFFFSCFVNIALRPSIKIFLLQVARKKLYRLLE